MLQIESQIVQSLDKVVIEFPDGGDKAKDNVNSYVLNNGNQFPLVQVSKTVLSPGDIIGFQLKMGQPAIPVCQVIFSDAQGRFRNTDYINPKTPIRVWLGYANSDEKPVNIMLTPIDTQVKNEQVIVKSKLALPSNRINIKAGTVQSMLEDFASQSRLGVLCNYDDLLIEEIPNNYENVTVEQFITNFAKYLGITNWYLDHRYNYCLIDVAQAISDHKDKTCDFIFNTTDKLETPQTVKYTNNLEENTQFRFTSYGYDFIDNDNYVKPLEAITYDKSFTPDLSKFQTSELQFTKQPPILDLSSLYFEMPFDPYKTVGMTAPFEIWTTVGKPKRVTMKEYQAGDKADMNQKLITDLSKVYFLHSIIYNFNAGRLSCWSSYVTPEDSK